jgi:hypothetical protein
MQWHFQKLISKQSKCKLQLATTPPSLHLSIEILVCCFPVLAAQLIVALLETFANRFLV